MKHVSRNPVMTRDSFALKQVISPLVTGDILEVTILDSNRRILYNHRQEIKPLLHYSSRFQIEDRGTVLYTLIVKVDFFNFVFIVLIFALGMLLLYLPFQKYEEKKFLNESNEALAKLSKKLAHDIRTPISTLNLISSKILDDNLKSLQMSVVNQINLIAEDLLSADKKNRSTSDFALLNPNFNEIPNSDYFYLFKSLENEYNFKSRLHDRVISFLVSEDLISVPAVFSKIIYPIVCNLINNSIEATAPSVGRISISVSRQSDRLCISVEDNGYGINAHVLSKLGSEIITLGKEKFKNSGNGVAIYNAKNDIQSHGGTLQITSEPYKKTEIIITLPLYTKS